MLLHKCENCINTKKEDAPNTQWWELYIPIGGTVCMSIIPTFEQKARSEVPLHFCSMKCLYEWLKKGLNL